MSRVPHVWTPARVKKLSGIAFLRSTRAELATADSVHQRTPVNLACLESEDGFVVGMNPRLYRRLGCPDRPTSTALFGPLEFWRGALRGPAEVPKFYISG